MDKYDVFSNKIGLNDEQKKAIANYIKEVIKENLLLMKDEYNNEIDSVINSLENEE